MIWCWSLASDLSVQDLQRRFSSALQVLFLPIFYGILTASKDVFTWHIYSTATRRKASNMALRRDELHHDLQHLNGLLTTHEAAKHLNLSYWHFMHLVEKGLIPGIRIVDRWLFSPNDLDAYRRKKYGQLEDLAKAALQHPTVELTEKQVTICHHLLNSERPSEIARKLNQSRQAVHSQIALIREKVTRTRIQDVALQIPNSAQNTINGPTAESGRPIPLRPGKK